MGAADATRRFDDLYNLVCDAGLPIDTHPNKPKYWVTARYFGMFNKARRDRWVFGDRDSGRYLAKFSWTKTVRDQTVKAARRWTTQPLPTTGRDDVASTSQQLHTPASHQGLLEPCARTTGPHGSEEGRRSNAAVLPDQTAKNECGLDDYQVRRYLGRHRQMTLAMAAHACLTVLRVRELGAGKVKTAFSTQ